MDFIMVSDSKLKITLTPEDVESFAFTGKGGLSENAHTKCVFRSLMCKARTHTGFSTENCKVFVQCFPSRDGGCELFVTKLGVSDSSISKAKSFTAKSVARQGLGKAGLRKYIFRTFSFSAFTCACRLLDTGRCTFLSSAYFDESCGYCLILTLAPERMTPSATHGKSRDDDGVFLSRLCEFGQFGVLDTKTGMYIAEHCRELVEHDAVKVFASLCQA